MGKPTDEDFALPEFIFSAVGLLLSLVQEFKEPLDESERGE